MLAEDARTLALRFHTQDGSPLAEFAKSGLLPRAILDEVRAIYLKHLALADRADVEKLAQYLAGQLILNDLKTELAARRQAE